MYSFNEAKVFADFADDQYIILDFITGAYYSFDRASSAVLKALTKGCSPEVISHAFVSRYGIDCNAEDRMNTFLNKLLAFEIVIPGGDGEGDGSELLSEIPEDRMPELDFDVFTDVADLLLMDPIHEVDESAGWPVQKQ